MLLGILGFFTFMALVQTVVLEVRGEPAGFAAVVLAVLALLLGLVVRRAAQRQTVEMSHDHRRREAGGRLGGHGLAGAARAWTG